MGADMGTGFGAQLEVGAEFAMEAFDEYTVVEAAFGDWAWPGGSCLRPPPPGLNDRFTVFILQGEFHDDEALTTRAPSTCPDFAPAM